MIHDYIFTISLLYHWFQLIEVYTCKLPILIIDCGFRSWWKQPCPLCSHWRIKKSNQKTEEYRVPQTASERCAGFVSHSLYYMYHPSSIGGYCFVLYPSALLYLHKWILWNTLIMFQDQFKMMQVIHVLCHSLIIVNLHLFWEDGWKHILWTAFISWH